MDGAPDEPPRIAFAIGRKVGSAVVRNRLRRRLRAVVNDLAVLLRPGAYLISAAPAAADLTFGELRSIVSQALEIHHLADAGGAPRAEVGG